MVTLRALKLAMSLITRPVINRITVNTPGPHMWARAAEPGRCPGLMKSSSFFQKLPVDSPCSLILAKVAALHLILASDTTCDT